MRKYIFEAGLNVFTSFKTLIPVEGLERFKQKRQTSLSHLWNIIV